MFTSSTKGEKIRHFHVRSRAVTAKKCTCRVGFANLKLLLFCGVLVGLSRRELHCANNS